MDPELSWISEISHSYIKENKKWSRSDYDLEIISSKQDIIVVHVSHIDDYNVEQTRGVLTAGGGKSINLEIDKQSQAILREIHFQ